MRVLYISVSCVNIVALLILEYILRKSGAINARSKRFFCLSTWVVICVIVAEITTVYFEGAQIQYRVLHILGNVVGFSLSPFIPLLIGCTIGEIHKNGLLLFWIPAGINFILAVFSAWFPIIFSVNAENLYVRGHGFWIYFVAYSIALIYLLIQTLLASRRYQNNNRLVSFVLFLFVGFGSLGQVMIPSLHISWLCVSFALALYYMYYCELLHQIDELTGLLNRRAYECSRRKMKSTGETAVILFDIDDFKGINDTHGHPFGDDCLVSISACIKKVFSKMGLCFRIGGDEFCVIAKATNKAEVEIAYQNFLYEIESIRKVANNLPMVSIGYAFADDKTDDIADTIFKADQNMYQFKRNRKGTARLSILGDNSSEK